MRGHAQMDAEDASDVQTVIYDCHCLLKLLLVNTYYLNS